MTRGRLAIGSAALACAVLAVACRSENQAISEIGSVQEPPRGLGLRAVAMPDFSQMEESVQEQMQARYAALVARLQDPETTRADLGTSYGEMGQLLMAAKYLDAAESCYLNAQALAASDSRWPYYLGHLYKINGPLTESVAWFERALQLQPSDLATLIWLGEGHLAQGRAEAAESMFAKAMAIDRNSAAARSGSGRAALARKEYAHAAKDLEEALTLEPRASGLHYSLALAYRGLGAADRAQAHFSQHGEIEPRPTDPLMWELDDLLQSAEAYNARGARALAARNAAAAADYFRKALELAPADVSLREQLGTALFQTGDSRGAVEQFEQILRTAPEYAKAHFSLGVVMESRGEFKKAIDRLATALTYEPGYVQARIRLAGLLGRRGRAQEALAEYAKALETDPSRAEAAFGHAMTLVRLHRYLEARDRLSDGMEAHPAQSSFGHALGRLLAAAPDDRVRDGRRAQVLVGQLLKQQPSIELGETMAMTLAELGQYEQAVGVQRDMLATATQAGLRDAVRRMTENLRLYESGRPCRRPFTDDELP